MSSNNAEEISEDVMESIALEMQDEVEVEEAELQETEQVAEDVSKEHEQSEDMPEMDEAEQLKVLEATLFAATEPLSPRMLHERLPKSADLSVLLSQLQDNYQGRGISLIEVDGHWAFRTSSEIAEKLTIEKEVSKKMSRAMLETMAIIAYHQPITRAEIENIRGVATHRGTLDTLMEMQWVKPGRRRETPGRPLTWLTTTKFLDHFQLESLRDLPGMDDLKASGLLDKRPAIETIPDTGDLFDSADEDAEEVLQAQEEAETDEEAYHEAVHKDIMREMREGE
ncbi:MAG: SMC-Scp complex subunit ScpB [Pseudomonadota bacterium]